MAKATSRKPSNILLATGIMALGESINPRGALVSKLDGGSSIRNVHLIPASLLAQSSVVPYALYCMLSMLHCLSRYCILLRCWLWRGGCVSQDVYLLHHNDHQLDGSLHCHMIIATNMMIKMLTIKVRTIAHHEQQ